MNKFGNFYNYTDTKKSNLTFVKHSDKYKEYLDRALKTK
jgi:hypothetical protein